MIPSEYDYKNFETEYINGDDSDDERENLGETYSDFDTDHYIDDFDDVFEPQSKDCLCCKGLIFQCEGKICKDLGTCYCKIHSEMENKKEENKLVHNV